MPRLIGQVPKTNREIKHNSYLRHLEKNREQARIDRKNLKIEVLSYYSDGSLRCACGESRLPCLSIDHINGGGNKQREELFSGRSGGALYRWLKQQGYPLGYQVLCMNCQWIKRSENDELAHRPKY